MYFAAPTDTITPINRELQMAEPVLRHVVTVCETVPESAHEPEADFDVSKVGLEPEPKSETPAPEKKAEESTEKPAKDSVKASDDAPPEAKASEDATKTETAEPETKEDN